MLTATCIRKVRAWGATEAEAMVRQSRIFTTPRTLPELANMLRNPEGRLLCPFGVDFEDSCGAGFRLSSLHRIPSWMALLEIHGDGYRYGGGNKQQLPYVFERVIGILRQRRVARQEASPGVAEHPLVVSDDLTNALVGNTVFRHKIAAHDLLTYALREPAVYLCIPAQMLDFRTMEQTNIESGRIRAVRWTGMPLGIEDAPRGKRMEAASSSNEGGVAAGPGVEDEVERQESTSHHYVFALCCWPALVAASGQSLCSSCLAFLCE